MVIRRAQPKPEPVTRKRRETEDKPVVDDAALRLISNGVGALQVGDEGPAIAELQTALGLEPTGVFDGEMAKLVAAFQRGGGLKDDGQVDADTLYALSSAFEAVAPDVQKLLGDDAKAAMANIEEAVDEGTGLNAHKTIVAAEEIALGVTTVRNAVEAATKAGTLLKPEALSKAADFAGVVLLPATAFYAAKDVRAALRARRDGDKSEVHQRRSDDATNRAAGSVGYFTSVAAGTAKEIAKASAHSSTLGRFIPGLSVVVAVGDLTWATTVCRDQESSKKKKTAACLSALGSVVSMVTPPPISWAASAVATGGLLASNFL